MTSSENEVEKISADLKNISVKVQQLEDKKKLLCVFQELRNRAEFGQTEEATATQLEIDDIDNKLQELRIKKAELQKNCDNILRAKSKKDTENSMDQDLDVSVSGSKIFFVEPPPSYPAPEVILDVKNFHSHAARTQCPECSQFVTTETFTSVSSVTWLVCFMTALIGCVAGCCLLPFCMDSFKSTTHKCPKCRTKITTVKKL